MAIFTNILTGGVNNHETTSENANHIATDFIPEGVVGAITNTSGVSPATGSFAVNEQSTPAMAVDVSAGQAYVTATPSGQSSQTFRINNNATAAASIAANSTGSTRYDWIYLDVDAATAAAPNTAGDDVTTIVVSRSTSASTDDGTPPTYGYALAVVTVANGASSIVDANITDKRVKTGTTPSTDVVTNAMLDTTAGELGGAWQSFSPTISNWTLGNGTESYKYTQIGKTVIAHYKLTLGSTSSVGGTLGFGLPVTAADSADVVGYARMRDDNTTFKIHAVAYLTSTTNARIAALNSTSNQQDVDNTNPFTWATDDSLQLHITYEAA